VLLETGGRAPGDQAERAHGDRGPVRHRQTTHAAEADAEACRGRGCSTGRCSIGQLQRTETLHAVQASGCEILYCTAQGEDESRMRVYCTAQYTVQHREKWRREPDARQARSERRRRGGGGGGAGRGLFPDAGGGVVGGARGGRRAAGRGRVHGRAQPVPGWTRGPVAWRDVPRPACAMLCSCLLACLLSCSLSVNARMYAVVRVCISMSAGMLRKGACNRCRLEAGYTRRWGKAFPVPHRCRLGAGAPRGGMRAWVYRRNAVALVEG
jgi:hypothetical protein